MTHSVALSRAFTTTSENRSYLRCGFHLMPKQGWLNDPNGLCQFDGTYHVFFQYAPDWSKQAPESKKGWGHYQSKNLCDWEYLDTAIFPSIPEDADGAYSGCAVAINNQLALYYTGNVKQKGDYDYIYHGRQAYEIMTVLQKDKTYAPKNVLLGPEDYPDFCSCHVRDPKVWKENDTFYMLLGARTKQDTGLCLVYRSEDGEHWQYAHSITANKPFGYMWECPTPITIEKTHWLGICPQGLPSAHDKWQNIYQAGYFACNKTLSTCTHVATESFYEWDMGFDFYAPQTFVDEQNRQLLVGWIGLPDEDYDDPELRWKHCLSVMRQLTPSPESKNRLRQYPIREIEDLRYNKQTRQDAFDIVHAIQCDMEMNIHCASGMLIFDKQLVFSWNDNELTLEFVGNTQHTRSKRIAHIDYPVRDLRVLIDGSVIEIFVNNGETVFTSRWYPSQAHIDIACRATCTLTNIWDMHDFSIQDVSQGI